MIGLERGKVALYPHTSAWEAEAARTIALLKDILGKAAADAAHVGSTAIRTIRAKPIIDIAVAVTDFADILRRNRELKAHGFYYRYATDGANGIVRGTTDFAGIEIRQLLYACGGYYTGSDEYQTHFIHAVKAESAEWYGYIRFRDFLIAHPQAAKEYETLKMRLSRTYADCREKYTAGKHAYIREILASAEDDAAL